jgi:hypothetical protein
LSRTSRLAPTGTSTARPAISPTCSSGVFGWVEVEVACVVRRAVVDRRDAVERRVVFLPVLFLLLVGRVVPWLVVAMNSLSWKLVFDFRMLPNVCL